MALFTWSGVRMSAAMVSSCSLSFIVDKSAFARASAPACRERTTHNPARLSVCALPARERARMHAIKRLSHTMPRPCRTAPVRPAWRPAGAEATQFTRGVIVACCVCAARGPRAPL
jgi:hypothetical protein